MTGARYDKIRVNLFVDLIGRTIALWKSLIINNAWPQPLPIESDELRREA